MLDQAVDHGRQERLLPGRHRGPCAWSAADQPPAARLVPLRPARRRRPAAEPPLQRACPPVQRL
eukprot:2158181-Pyramimonas_sp.AAC.1